MIGVVLVFAFFACVAAGMWNLSAARALEGRPTQKKLPRAVDIPFDEIPSVADHDARIAPMCGHEAGKRLPSIDEWRAMGSPGPDDDTRWMQTYSGRKFYPLEPRAEDVDLADVAHGLAMTCRYGGHARLFYSVAEHCVLVSEFVEMHARNAGKPEDEVRRLAQCALMHDSAEAYIGDMVRPLKHQPEMAEFRRAEAAIELAIADAFKLKWTPEAHEIVKTIDDRILVDEISYLMPNPEMYIRPWLRDLSPLGAHFHCMPPSHAQDAFMLRYRELFT